MTLPHDVFRRHVVDGVSLLRAWREHLERSEADLAAALGVPKGRITEWEASDAEIPPDVLLDLAAVLGLSTEDLTNSGPWNPREDGFVAATIPVAAEVGTEGPGMIGLDIEALEGAGSVSLPSELREKLIHLVNGYLLDVALERQVPRPGPSKKVRRQLTYLMKHGQGLADLLGKLVEHDDGKGDDSAAAMAVSEAAHRAGFGEDDHLDLVQESLVALAQGAEEALAHISGEDGASPRQARHKLICGLHELRQEAGAEQRGAYWSEHEGSRVGPLVSMAKNLFHQINDPTALEGLAEAAKRVSLR